MIRDFIKETQRRLTDKGFLMKLGETKKGMTGLLNDFRWKERISGLAEKGDFSAGSLAESLKPLMERWAEEPEEGWLEFICNEVKSAMYPENFTSRSTEGRGKARFFFMENYRAMLKYERKTGGTSPVSHIDFLPAREVKECITFKEYEKLRAFWTQEYIFEFMRINREITPFNTIGHIAGVHYVAVFIGNQLRGTDVPIDMALLSGAAAGHDLGKFGCSPAEAARTPYLHYYYTDELLKRKGMPMISHIASNHSTWDLELENLSVESLILIYADFRVKSSREEGEEIVHFYTLEEAFDVILGKLDNVDMAKRHRYEKVYAKLKDFEDYLVDIGVQTDVWKAPSEDVGLKDNDVALMMGGQVVEHIKYTAIEHNIQIMNIFNNENAFGSLIEAARSEKQWKSQRAYLNILSEYSTYMTKPEKLLTVNFLYELLSHREGDIRRQAGRLMGNVISGYDDVYRKEIPEGAVKDDINRDEAAELWDTYLHKIVFPDYRVTDQHRSWIGYTLKVVIFGLLEKADRRMSRMFMERYFRLFGFSKVKDSAVFVLLDSVISVPMEMFSDEDMVSVLDFVKRVSIREQVEIKIGALRAAEYISGKTGCGHVKKAVLAVIDNVGQLADSISVAHLISKTLKNIGEDEAAEEFRGKIEKLQRMGTLSDEISGIFRENLKVGTPWVVKIVNMEFLLEYTLKGRLKEQTFYLATHFSNLIKVSERVTVRHQAGRSLIEIARALPIEQIKELVIELTKGLEIGEYQFSKYIPEYLGELVLYLYPTELDEFIDNLGELMESSNDKVGSVALDTVGEVIRKYSSYKYRSSEARSDYEDRKTRMLGMLLKGLANYHEVVSQEAIMVTGQYIFGSEELSMEEKYDAFRQIYKKLLTLIADIDEYDMNFFTNAAALNHIYRFISEYKFNFGKMELPENSHVAFFPGTFDPFSLSHKGIVQAIRNEGFEVYLAIDEFSWSKKTQARMIRRQIISMSVADEPDVFLFADDFPVNIANPKDLKRLKELFPGKEIYMVAGSDVIINASSYKAEPEEDSIHSMNHIVFQRETLEGKGEDRIALKNIYRKMSGNIRELKLPVYLEDISSTRIRENIDYGRDISNLIDPVVQNFIYDNSLYLREPQYKNVFEAKNISFDSLKAREGSIIDDMEGAIAAAGGDTERIREYIGGPEVRTAVIRNEFRKVCAIAAVNEIETGELYDEFKDLDIASYLREKATGRMLIIRGIYCAPHTDMRNLLQIITTEVIAEAVADDITYGIYHPLEGKADADVLDVLERQGFTEISIKGKKQGVYEVNMKEPIVVIENMDTALKEPFNTNHRILDVLEETHADMQRALTKLNPGNLVLSFNAGIMHQKIVDMVTKANHVPNYTGLKRKLGECMCVPFGKILRGMVVPNTVTKTLHTEKMFTPTLDDFTIEEYPMYATIPNQIRTIKSFGRPVILVDDLLHKGYRIQALDPIFKENDVVIRKMITGVLSGHGEDLMTIQGRDVESAYFIPNLKAWFVESTLCPFIGGDGVRSMEQTEASLIPSINLILPFAAPSFLKDCSRESVYGLSMVCLRNAAKIFQVLEEEYQVLFERKLTIKRLSDAVKSPRMPNGSNRVSVDSNLAPSVYMEDYIERLIRLKDSLI